VILNSIGRKPLGKQQERRAPRQRLPILRHGRRRARCVKMSIVILSPYGVEARAYLLLITLSQKVRPELVLPRSYFLDGPPSRPITPLGSEPGSNNDDAGGSREPRERRRGKAPGLLLLRGNEQEGDTPARVKLVLHWAPFAQNSTCARDQAGRGTSNGTPHFSFPSMCVRP
jgi:hypothetical protein